MLHTRFRQALFPLYLVMGMGLTLALPPAANPQSDTVWTFRYGPVVGGGYEPLASFVDATGSVYVAGWAEQVAGRQDVFLLKIDSSGHLVWHTTYDNMTAAGAARDTSGNIYIAGVTRGSSTNGEICLLKYKPNGDTDWVQTYGEPRKDFVALGSIAIDDSQNVYACGEAESSSCFAVRVVKYRPNSPRVDTIRYTLRGYSELDGGDFHILGNGEAYLALSVEHPTRWADWLTVKLSRQGQVLWERIYKDTDSTWEQLCWSQVDERANIYLTGIVTGPTYQSQAAFCTMKIDSSGNVLWTREYNGPENLRDEPRFLMLKSGYVYVAGWSVYKEMGEDQATALVKYDSLGNQQWASRYGSADTDADEGYEFYDHDQPDVRSINVDDSGNVYLTGYLCHSGIGVVGILLQYGPQGNLVRVRKLSTPGERWFGAIVDVDNTGAIYGVGKVIGGGIDVFVVKYRGRQR